MMIMTGGRPVLWRKMKPQREIPAGQTETLITVLFLERDLEFLHITHAKVGITCA